MAHSFELKDESDVSKVIVPQGFRNDGFFVKTDLYVELGGDNRLRSLFDQVLSYFLKGVSVNKDVIRGFPPKLGDGVEADLFTLFWVVRKMGDYELVSKNKLWEFVAEECGLDVIHVSSLKLIYNKYLKEMDQWLSHGGFKDTKLEKGELGVLEKLGSLFRELRGFKYSLSNVEFQNDKGKCVVIDSSDDKGIERFRERLDLDMAKAELGFSRINNLDEKDEEFRKADEKIEDLSHDIVVKKVNVSRIDNEYNDASENNNNTRMFAKMIVKNVVSSRKRKKEESLPFLKMLDWVENAARNPLDIAIGNIPNSSNWKKYNSNEVWKQVLLVKDSLFAKQNVDTGNKVYDLQNKRHMMHPSMYEDGKTPVQLSSERIRCSQRVSSVKSCSCPGCTTSSSSRTKSQKPDVKKSLQILETAGKDDSKKSLQILKVQDDVCKDLETDMATVRAEVPESTGSLFRELRGYKCSLSNLEFENNKRGKCVVINSSDDGGIESALGFKERLDLDTAKAEMGFSRINNLDEKDEEFRETDEKIEELPHDIVVKKVDVSRIDNEYNDASENDNNTMMSAKMTVKNAVSSRKRKKEESLPFLKMLDWVENAARNPHDVTIGNIPNSSNWKKYNSNEVWKQVLLAKDSLFAKRNVDTGNKVYGSQKKRHMMHPSMYENDKTPIHLSSNRIRCSQRVSSIKSCSCPGCTSCSSSRTKRQKPDVKKSLQILENAGKHDSKKSLQILENAGKHDSKKSLQILENAGKPDSKKSLQILENAGNPDSKKSLQIFENAGKPDSKKSLQILKVQDDVCKDLETDMLTVGAEVPEWTGVVSESDPKWLGTRMWPQLENTNSKKHKGDIVVIGKGRQSWCRCSFPGSADCVRFHISKKRTRVKRMLGPLFYKWKFNHMGEEASCSSWSLEEEKEFKSLVIKARQELTHKSKSRHEIMTNFWRRASKSIPSKTKDALVSYYFNVFVLRRRSYQNRIMPANIDSDDDEQEVE